MFGRSGNARSTIHPRQERIMLAGIGQVATQREVPRSIYAATRTLAQKLFILYNNK